MRPRTRVLHSAYRADPITGAVAVPIYQTTAFLQPSDVQETAEVYNVQRDGFTYTRIINPTTRVLERRFADVVGGRDAIATSSGQGATSLAALNLCQAGDNIVISPHLYGNTWNLFRHTLRRLGIEARVVGRMEASAFVELTDEHTKFYFGETLSNPTLVPFPVEDVAAAGASLGVPLIIDNTLTTLLATPERLGAAMTVYSATKYVGGHGTTMGGLVVDSGSFDWLAAGQRFPTLNGPDEAHNFKDWHHACANLDDAESAVLLKARMTVMRDIGFCLDPLGAFQLLQGLETLPLRMAAHDENAATIATFLNEHPSVSEVRHPSLFSGREAELARASLGPAGGGIIFFDLRGGMEAGMKFISNLRRMYHVSNVGDARTLATHPASTTHTTIPREKREAEGIGEGSIRLSIGLEDPDDLIDELSALL